MKDFFQNRGYVGVVGNPFVQLDREKVAARLRLDDKGQANGELEIPATDATLFDAVESDIVAEIGDHVARAHIEATGELSTYNTRISQLDKLAQVSTLPGIARAAIGDMNAALNGWKNIIFPHERDVRESVTELQSFRRAHDLRRPAHDALPMAATAGALLVAWAVEVVLNTAFLRVNDDLGVLGGAAAAALVATVNLFALGAFAGLLCFRQLNHRDLWRKRAARAGIVLWAMAVLAWNIFAAHYRDAKSAMHPSADSEAIRLTLSQPLSFDGILSVGFLVVGIVFSVFAAQRFYKMDDPYPGFGDVWRRHQARSDEYLEEVAAAREELQSIRDRAVSNAAALRSGLSTQLAELAQIRSGRTAFLRNYSVHTKHLEQDGNFLLARYRLANRRARKTPAPPHFDAPWELPSTDIGAELPLPILPADLEAQVTSAQLQLERAITDINDAFDAAERQFTPLAALQSPGRDG